MNLKGNISLKQLEHVVKLWKPRVSYLCERNYLISNKQTFWHLMAILLHGHCSARAEHRSPFCLLKAVLPVLLLKAKMGLQASVGWPQLTPTETHHAILCRRDFSYHLLLCWALIQGS